MLVSANSSSFQLVDKHINRWIVLVSSHDNRIYLKIIATESIDEPHYLKIIRDPKILSRFTGNNVSCIYADDYFRLVLHAVQKFNLGILIEARQNSHRVLILNEFPSEFEVKSPVSSLNPLQDIL